MAHFPQRLHAWEVVSRVRVRSAVRALGESYVSDRPVTRKVRFRDVARRGKGSPGLQSLGLRPKNLAMNSNQVRKPIVTRMRPPIKPASPMKAAKRLGM